MRRPAGARPPAALLALALLLAGCTSTAPTAPDAGPGTDEISAAVAVVNAAAGSAADQRAALASVTDPQGRPALDRCPQTTRTVRFEPVHRAATPDPAFTDLDGNTPPGLVLAVPTLVRVYAGDALATTEVTTLHLGVANGVALFAPLCLG